MSVKVAFRAAETQRIAKRLKTAKSQTDDKAIQNVRKLELIHAAIKDSVTPDIIADEALRKGLHSIAREHTVDFAPALQHNLVVPESLSSSSESAVIDFKAEVGKIRSHKPVLDAVGHTQRAMLLILTGKYTRSDIATAASTNVTETNEASTPDSDKDDIDAEVVQTTAAVSDNEDGNEDENENENDSDNDDDKATTVVKVVDKKSDSNQQKKSASKQKASKPSSIKSTMFVDSLGGGDGDFSDVDMTDFSGSDNDAYASDSDYDEEDLALLAENSKRRKPNRPGQQARRKKWEEQYGYSAKHIQAKVDAGEMSLPRHLRGAKPGRGEGERGGDRGRGRGRGGYAGRDGGNGGRAEFDRRPRDDQYPPRQQYQQYQQPQKSEPLHPSWEAKKREREAMANAAVPQGKRITFDMDDGGSVAVSTPPAPAAPQSSSSGYQSKKPAPAESLHPSWEAKRREREAMASAAVPQNKKITFNFDD
ncbi:BUD22-domain-containing protein [Ramicandelaber brevisporus]|nr:BUD22-domain-containing protein [Ramicandelaber brevisporus]